ncbi:MAG: NnrS family protein, partial [Gammaproteobacteria bacterium]
SNIPSRFALFAYGFRPFFWGAGAFAFVAGIAWMVIYATGSSPLPAQPPQLWHAHEMVYGFVVAAIAGFLLTAVPGWTGARGFAGAPLVALSAVWLAGRTAFAASTVLPITLVAVCDLAFLPALAVLIGPPLLRARNRNTPLLLVLAAIWLSDAAFLYALLHSDVFAARAILVVAVDIILLLMTVIGGRVVPAFTASALRARGEPVNLRSNPWVDRLVISVMVLVVLTDTIVPGQHIAGALAALAAVVQAWRFTGWGTLRTLRDPLVWSLHLAYAWLPLGLALKAVHLLTNADWSAYWLHALTIGVAASMILAVMTRAALGHTGRPLVPAKAIAVAYALLSCAALARVFGPALLPAHYLGTVLAAGSLWAFAFLLFLIVYTPILMRPRVDSRPG